MRNDSIHSFFKSSIPVLYVIPLFIVIAGFSVRYDVFSRNTDSGRGTVGENYHTPTPAPVSVESNHNQFRFTDSFACEYENKEATVSAYRRENSLHVSIIGKKETEYYLLSGDCLYNWGKSSRAGVKKCGVGKILGMVDSVLSTGLISLSSVASMVPKSAVGSDFQTMGINPDLLIRTCKNIRVQDDGIFEVPKKIIFTDIKE